MALAVLNSDVNQLGVFGLLGCGEDERWVGGGILGLVFANGYRISVCAFGDRIGFVVELREDGLGVGEPYMRNHLEG